MKTLEEIALQVADSIQFSTTKPFTCDQIEEFARRLAAALGAQSSVGESDGDGTVWWKDMPSSGTQLYAAPVVNPDWQMVPKEPTEAMLLAMKDGAYSIEREQDEPRLTVYDAIRLEYKAMLSAAPEYGK